MLVSVNVPSRPVGDPMEIPGVGLFPNGAVYDMERDGDNIIVGDPIKGKKPPVKYSSLTASDVSEEVQEDPQLFEGDASAAPQEGGN